MENILNFQFFGKLHIDSCASYRAAQAMAGALGHYILVIPYADHTGLIMDILRQGHHVEVLEPAELRLEIRKEAELMASAYK
ncbi:MAG: WYL domain-containing protein [Gallionella sp.]|jgi:predicted DNA-binding transcriptional regulator YafY